MEFSAFGFVSICCCLPHSRPSIRIPPTSSISNNLTEPWSATPPSSSSSSSRSGSSISPKTGTVERARGDGHFPGHVPCQQLPKVQMTGGQKRTSLSQMILVDACTSVLSCTSTLLSLPSHPSADLSPAST
ncbi:hypothetical protein K456DRAFT_78294 [Colletotrichum gloeosporioides 23]|nr:hypothetical protein K456DRAFT_78294 [Colletotrichum gloeosporioides 23]